MDAEHLLGTISAIQVHAGSAPTVAGHLLENGGLLPPDVELGDTRDRNWLAVADRYQLHQSLRVGIGEGLKEYRVDHRKDRGVHANTQGNNEERNGCKAGRSAKKT